MVKRYPNICVGFWTNGNPDETIAIRIAIGKGAVLFEKHVGIPTAEWPLNPYSASPEQARAWLKAAQEALVLCGALENRYTGGKAEQDSLNALRRGVYAKRPIPAGKIITNEDVFFAFPPQENQLLANDWSKHLQHKATRDIPKNQPVTRNALETSHLRQRIRDAVKEVKTLFRNGHIVVPGKSELEISHHYGMDRFDDYGLVMITVINREYCKKLLVMLPGQTHPEQYHLKKEETFLVLHGEVEFSLDGQTETYRSGDVVTVARGVRHKFHTRTGVVFEELSSSHYPDDSYYSDPAIQNNPNRKTLLTYWM